MSLDNTHIPGTAVSLSNHVRNSLRPAAASLPESGIIELVNYGREIEDLIPMWVGEGDLPTPAFICDAATAALEAGQTYYTWQRGIPELRQALANYYHRHFQVQPGAERIIVTGSGMQGMMESLQATVGAGDEVIVVSPVWPNIYACIHLQQATARSIPLRQSDSGWALDMDELASLCNDKTRAIYINSPGNPTGWMMPEAQMLALRDLARGKGIWILSDEVYGKFSYEQRKVSSFLQICTSDDQLIVCNSFSKNWAMTGWRVGWVVIPPSLGQIFENLVQYNTSGVPEFLQRGCVAAAENGDALLQQQIARATAGRAIVSRELSRLSNVVFTPPAGAFYLFFRVHGEADCVALAKQLVDRAKVGVAPGSAFGLGGNGFLRICFLASEATLNKAMQRLVETLDNW